MRKLVLLHNNLIDDDDKSYIIIIVAFLLFVSRLMCLYCSCNINYEPKHNRYEKIKFNDEQEYYDTCTICLDDFDNNEKILKLTCKHIYHEKCIKTWFTKKSNCPNCNNSFSSDDNISPICDV
jgi:hypothetical protein